MPEVGIVILAAGASTRLGQPKQLLPYRGKPLIRQMVEVAIASTYFPISVVLGANAEIIQPHLTDLAIHPVDNEQWSTGMASSIRCGLQEMLAIAPNLQAIILMLCDQPFVTPDLLRQLVAGYQTTHAPIVASEYAGILGVPALFHQSLFPELLALEGDVGARAVIRQYRSTCLRIPFEEGAIDLDTPEDLDVLSLPG